MKTTLNKIREHSPCTDGWKKLLSNLGKTRADDEEVNIIQVLDSNGIADAIWCLRAVTGRDREVRLFAVWCARQVEHLTTDPRVKHCNDVVEKFANGEATKKELDAAGEAVYAARAAARAAVYTAWEAAWGAAWEAAGEAARAAARAAAGEAALAAAGEAALAAVYAAWEATGKAQEKELRRICLICESE